MLYLIRVLIAISGDSDRSTTSPYGDKSLSMNPIVRIFIPKHPYLRMESSVRMDKNIRMFGAFHIHETIQTYGCFFEKEQTAIANRIDAVRVLSRAKGRAITSVEKQ